MIKIILSFLGIANLIVSGVMVSMGNYGMAVFNFGVFIYMLHCISEEP